MIKAIFYSQFLPKEGPKVLHQVPDGAVVPTPTTPTPTLFNFDSISTFVIPQHEFCNRLVTVTKDGYRVLGHPIRIYDEAKYKRNDFIFNFAIVLEEDADMSSYKSVVTKLARLFRALEEQSGFLSGAACGNGGGMGVGMGVHMGMGMGGGGVEGGGRNGGKIFAMLEQILEDLNNYCECMIPIDESNTINIKLFPKYPPPPPVKAWHVPISTVNLEHLMDVNWDLTMQKIIPHLPSHLSVRTLSQRAQTSYPLTVSAIRHLLYYGCLLLLDTFSFSAIYAPTAEFPTLVSSPETQAECAAYVSLPPSIPTTTPTTTSSPDYPALTPTVIVSLYASTRQGLSVKNWAIEHAAWLGNVDVRRFITFGVIKGFLYRVHKYPIKTTDSASPPAADLVASISGVGGAGTATTAPTTKTGAASTIHTAVTAATATAGGGGVVTDKRKTRDLPLLAKYLDGSHCLDEICTDLGWSERDVLRKLGAWGDVYIIHR